VLPPREVVAATTGVSRGRVHQTKRVGHDHHHHGVTADADGRKLATALVLILAFMCVEVAVGIVADSLALLSDAAHMLTDAGALALSLIAIRLARRPAAGAMTYGLKRSEILAAAINGTTLLVLGVLIVIEGIRRIVNPPDVEGGLVLAVAILGIAVNLVATMILARANRQSLNIEGAYQHILTDLAAFIATAIAGAVVLATGYGRADGIAALFVAARAPRPREPEYLPANHLNPPEAVPAPRAARGRAASPRDRPCPSRACAPRLGWQIGAVDGPLPRGAPCAPLPSR